MRPRRPLKFRNPLAWTAAGFALGIWAGRFLDPLPTAAVFAIGATAVLALAAFHTSRQGRLRTKQLAAAVGALPFGWIAGWLHYHNFPAHHVKHLPAERVYATVWGRVTTIPEKTIGNVEVARHQPQRARWTTTFVVECGSVSVMGGEPQPCAGKIFVTVQMLAADAVRAGQSVRLEGVMSPPRPGLNPGGFDAASYQADRRIYRELRVNKEDITVTGLAQAGDLLTWAEKFRNYMRRALTVGVEDDPFACAILAGKLYGDREGFGPQWTEWFRRTGTMHLFAVSGQNIGVLLAVGLIIFWLGGINRWRWAAALILPLAVYALATGGQPSAIRAFVMGALLLAAWRFDRPVRALNLLGSACVLILLLDPTQLFDVGFQLSVGVVLSLILFTGKLYHKMALKIRPHFLYPEQMWDGWTRARVRLLLLLSGLLSATLAAFIGSFPLTYLHFHLVSWVSLPANFIVVPVAAVMVILGAISIMTAWVLPWLAVGINNINWLLVGVITWTVSFFSNLPGGSFYAAHPQDWFAREPRLVVLSAGTNLSVLSISQNGTDLIGGGNDYTLQSVTLPAMKHYGINSIRRHVLPAGLADVSGGALTLRRYFAVSEYYQNPLRNRGRTLRQLRLDQVTKMKNLIAGQSIQCGDHRWEVFWPGQEDLEGDLTSSTGAILRWSADFAPRVIIAPNPDFRVLEKLGHSMQDLSAEILVLSGRRGLERLPDSFLAAVSPNVIVLSTGGFRPSRVSPLLQAQAAARSITIWDLEVSGAFQISAGASSPTQHWPVRR